MNRTTGFGNKRKFVGEVPGHKTKKIKSDANGRKISDAKISDANGKSLQDEDSGADESSSEDDALRTSEDERVLEKTREKIKYVVDTMRRTYAAEKKVGEGSHISFIFLFETCISYLLNCDFVNLSP